MILAQWAGIRLYLETAAGLALGWPVLVGVTSLPLRASTRLALAYLTLALVLASPILARALPAPDRLNTRVQVWAPSRESRNAAFYFSEASPDSAARGGRSPPDPERTGVRVPLAALRGSLLALAVLLAISLLRRRRERRALERALEPLPRIRAFGRVRVLVQDSSLGHPGPYSCRANGRAVVVVPARMLEHPRELRIAIRHELQHHRQGDTRAARVLEALRSVFPGPLGVRAWMRAIHPLQEFACDEALIGRRGISPQAYGRCLLKAVELAALPFAPPVGTTGMAGRRGAAPLQRRIRMFSRHQSLFRTRRETQAARARIEKAAALALALGVLAAFTAASRLSLAAVGAAVDRSISLEEARQLAGASAATAETASSEPSIPLAVNEQVVRELNRFVGTPGGRAQIRGSLARMPRYREMIEGKLRRYGLPTDLIVVPIVESSYDNRRRPSTHGQGIWSFIAPTARHYDLKVDGSSRDERFDEKRETEAAARYFRDLHNIFHDWRLALRAYNEGESRVMQLIKTHGTRDPWELERLEESREHYLSSVTAALLILKNPSLAN